MPSPGRPRLTREEYEERLAAYCAKYKVAPLVTGIPPFPTGRRETSQHREWMALYKAKKRLGGDGASLESRRALLQSQGGDCSICGKKVDLRDSVERGHSTSRVRAVLHPPCNQLVGLAEAVGPEALGRLRFYLWPRRTRE